MKYATSSYSAEQINKAGNTLRDWTGGFGAQIDLALEVMDNFRASHAYPAQSFYVTLKRRACKVHKNALVAQRTKRLPSIISKLNRERNMKLSQMQDIAGCRAVVSNIAQVNQLKNEILTMRWKHEPLNPKDYIEQPKPSGYRGIHLKYRYIGTGEKSQYSGLKVELQLRTSLQHRWATAVEAADTITKQSLKSSRGSLEWQRFFALMSSTFAMRERTPLVPGTPTELPELVSEIKELNSRHHIVAMFSGYAEVLTRVEQAKDAAYFLVTLDPLNLKATIKGFRQEHSQFANSEYAAAEKNLPPLSTTQIVLVSVSSIAALKRVYPNYFLDTKAFLDEVKAILK